MEYSMSKKFNGSFKAAVESVTAELKKEGFGIITEVDLKDKFKEKLNIEFGNYTILGACNPAMAHKAILAEEKIGVMLPSNVLVHEKENGEVEIAAINPLHSIGAIENESLGSIAAEITGRLRKAVDAA